MVLTYCFLRLTLKHEPCPGPSSQPQALKAANVTVYAKLYSSVYIIPFDLYSKCGHKDSFLRILMKKYDTHIINFDFPLLSCISLLLLTISCSAGKTHFILQNGY
jgi:hypothetical protein